MPPRPVHALRIGQYVRDGAVFDVFERDGLLMVIRPDLKVAELKSFRRDRCYLIPEQGRDPGRLRQITFEGTNAPSLHLTSDRFRYDRRDLGAETIGAFQATTNASAPPRPSRAARPASGGARPDLIAVQTVAPDVREDMKYASADNFLGFPVYERPEAFLHRPVAEALSWVNEGLRQHGFGLVVLDAYRPWTVTRLFWDNVPEPYRGFVAHPAVGSVHNRGCAVDLTLWDLATGSVVDMPGRYDEPTGRSARDYIGGTSLQRWRRSLLEAAMQDYGFSGHPAEWWHFDFAGWEDIALEDRSLESL